MIEVDGKKLYSTQELARAAHRTVSAVSRVVREGFVAPVIRGHRGKPHFFSEEEYQFACILGKPFGERINEYRCWGNRFYKIGGPAAHDH
jgi:hypothetical protein